MWKSRNIVRGSGVDDVKNTDSLFQIQQENCTNGLPAIDDSMHKTFAISNKTKPQHED